MSVEQEALSARTGVWSGARPHFHDVAPLTHDHRRDDLAVCEWRVIYLEEDEALVRDGPREYLRVVYASSPTDAAVAVRRDRWPTEIRVVGVVRID